MTISLANHIIKGIAKVGLTAKGVVYSLIGVLVFMAAFGLGRHGGKDVDKEKAFSFIESLPAGKWWLAIVALGLLCYVVWRFVQSSITNDNVSAASKISKKIRYILSGLVYLSLAFLAIKMVFRNESGDSKSKQDIIDDIMQKDQGPLLIGIAALVIAAVGVYQIYYSFSEKYKKHVSLATVNTTTRDLLFQSGKIGYLARGIVWLIIAWLFGKAALHSNAAEAGDTGKAFQFLESASYGSYLLGILGLGLLCYGIFNFIRARFETFR
jgi:type IV secretory pathway VirB2 component (pilin)